MRLIPSDGSSRRGAGARSLRTDQVRSLRVLGAPWAELARGAIRSAPPVGSDLAMADRLTDSPELLRLGIDLDGVVADFNAGWIERYNRDFGAALHPDHVLGWDELHRLTAFHTMDEFWAWAKGDGRTVFRDLPPVAGAIDSLRELAERHRIVIITARFDWAIGDTLAWLAEHHVLAREVHFQAAKYRIPCDVYLDDSPEQIEALARECPDRIVCRQVTAWNRSRPGVIDVHSWAQFRDVVDGLARDRADPVPDEPRLARA